MNIIGDVFLDKAYSSNFEFDKFVFNLEYPITENFSDPALNKVNLYSAESYIKETFNKMPCGVFLANNHIFDFGIIGAKSTIDYLEKNKIKYCGIGNKANNFNNPMILEDCSENLIEFYNYCCLSTNPSRGSNEIDVSIFNLKKVQEDLRDSIEHSTLKVVSIHWGDEEIKYASDDMKLNARTLIDSGADIIIGHHAHVVQETEIYKGKYIFYGIGNAIFPDLSVKSYYTESKNFSIFEKQQSQKNREGYLVQVNGDQINVMKSYFHNNSYNIEIKVNKFISPSVISFNSYRKFFRRYIMIKNFLRSPKLPDRKRLARFLKGLD
ncbi:putative Capsule synthesis protein CapA [Vibrio nigripulchritudo SFn27]|uniref:Putative Capsule synthesis protein CapA n=1 Tax=Vibrio nigripulchritudo TaxID=28173 RepID=U4KHK0_9VIBR|nr:CapA family protein [Vibrio nigripulchritudo]CCN80338.1 putative Capsule synthesis protein CapA [Vibrio nigripulchritudo BLFn1]CCN91262.1 putative Capsule synthesis protein CapA [Vibrio nigripulchritudo SFn27]CCN92653.1 putative Capsule synthesis protein CapA [Vibrio nigripulchritudo ENn2]CCO41057.1 putative Capsule synthesis protein CapA [Vibrio nigripulchritudo SFn135]CCO50603.1 putative Capsule synthesis protein CapA [Vibrio nigripulchritudo Wn13]